MSKITNPVGRAKSEKSFQTSIERMQIAVAKNKVGATDRVQRASRELQTLKNNELDAKKHGITLVSNYATLLTIFNADLLNLTMEVLSANSEQRAQKVVKRAKSVVTDAQAAVIVEYFAMQAQRDFEVRGNIIGILTLKGLLKPAVKAKVPAKGATKADAKGNGPAPAETVTIPNA